MNNYLASVLLILIFCCNVHSFQFKSLSTEEDFKKFIELKVDYVCEKMLNDHERKIVSQDKKLNEFQQRYETQNEILREHTRKLEIQEKLLKEHERKFELQEKRLKKYEQTLEYQNRLINDQANRFEELDGHFHADEENFEVFDKKGNTTDEHKRNAAVQQDILKRYDKTRIMNKSRRAVSEGIAFSVQLSVKQNHIGLAQTIKYDKVHLNDGDGYSVHSGVFTAPKSGVYMFSYILGHGAEPAQAWLELMHNGVKINAAVTDTFHTYEDLQGGNFAIIRLEAGDSVWVQSWHQNDAYIDGPYGFTSFSGAFLY